MYIWIIKCFDTGLLTSVNRVLVLVLCLQLTFIYMTSIVWLSGNNRMEFHFQFCWTAPWIQRETQSARCSVTKRERNWSAVSQRQEYHWDFEHVSKQKWAAVRLQRVLAVTQTHTLHANKQQKYQFSYYHYYSIMFGILKIYLSLYIQRWKKVFGP